MNLLILIIILIIIYLIENNKMPSLNEKKEYYIIDNLNNKIINNFPKYINNDELIEAGLGKYYYIAGGFVHDSMNDIKAKGWSYTPPKTAN